MIHDYSKGSFNVKLWICYDDKTTLPKEGFLTWVVKEKKLVCLRCALFTYAEMSLLGLFYYDKIYLSFVQ
jgi:hypothetical protein